MEEIKGFVCELLEREIKKVVIDLGDENYYIETKDLLNEISKKFSTIEIMDTYYEDLSFISSSGNLVEIHALY